VPEIDNELRAPAEPIRTMPLSLHGPQSLHEQVRVKLPQDWPDAKLDRTIASDAFRLSKSLRIRDRELAADYTLEIGKDQVAAAMVPTFTADIGRAQDLLGDSLSTAHSGEWYRVGAAWAAGGAAAAVALLWAFAWRRARHGVDPEARAAVGDPVPDVGPDTAANDSRQPLAA